MLPSNSDNYNLHTARGLNYEHKHMHESGTIAISQVSVNHDLYHYVYVHSFIRQECIPILHAHRVTAASRAMLAAIYHINRLGYYASNFKIQNDFILYKIKTNVLPD